MTSEGNSALLTAGEIYSHKFVHEKVFLPGLYNKSLKFLMCNCIVTISPWPTDDDNDI